MGFQDKLFRKTFFVILNMSPAKLSALKSVGVVGDILMRLKETYEKYIEHLRLKGLTKKTIVEHSRFLFGSLSHSIENREIVDLKITDVDYVVSAGNRHGEYGAQRSVVVFRQLLKFLKQSGYAISFDWRDIRVPKVPQKPVEFLTPEEMELIRNKLPNDLSGIRARALIEVLYDTGMRISEAISLNKEDIDWNKKEVKVLNAKTKEWGTVYFTERSFYWLKKYLETRKDDLPALFISGRGRLVRSSSGNYLRTHLRSLGIKKKITHHIFRRSFVTSLIQGNVDIKSVQTLARHKSERTTLRCYTGIDVKRAKELHQKVMGKL